MEIKLNIPDYLSIKDWKYFNKLELMSDMDRMIHFISYIAKIEIDEVKKWTPGTITEAYSKTIEILEDSQPKFYPVFELEGVKYGFSAISKMSLGEYVDLERLTKNPEINLEEIMALLYRPITKHKFNTFKWGFKSKYKVAQNQIEDPFKYFTIEAYDSDVRKDNATMMEDLPVSFALGALNFFLAQSNMSLLGMQAYSLPSRKEQIEAMKKAKESVSINIGDGLLQFITSLKHPSLASQEIKVSQI